MITYTETLTEGTGVRIAALDESGAECGRTFLYVLKNDLHEEPFGFLEDMFVREDVRTHGVGSELLARALQTARMHKCYKVLGTSRFEREAVHAWYEKRGFSKRGYEFRIDL